MPKCYWCHRSGDDVNSTRNFVHPLDLVAGGTEMPSCDDLKACWERLQQRDSSTLVPAACVDRSLWYIMSPKG